MDYIKPYQLIEDVAAAGAYKSSLSIQEILIKGVLSGAFLGFATTLAYTATTETGLLRFPIGGYGIKSRLQSEIYSVVLYLPDFHFI